jgi:hypothetical protein
MHTNSQIPKRVRSFFCIQIVVCIVIHSPWLLQNKTKITLKFIFKSDNCSKVLKSSFIFFACSKLWSINNIVSSAYWRIERPSSTTLCITPEICPSPLALLIRITNISTIILNMIGDKGSPCLTPFFV